MNLKRFINKLLNKFFKDEVFLTPREVAQQRQYFFQANRVFFSLIAIAMAFIIGRLWYIQVHEYKYYCEQASKHRIRIIKLKPPRGKILDRYGRVIAGNRPRFNLCIIRQDASGHIPELLMKISKLIGVPEYKLKQNLLKGENSPIYKPIILVSDIKWDALAKIEARLYSMPGVTITVDSQRKYPLGSLAPHLIGYLREASIADLKRFKDLDPGDLVGKRGVEREFQTLLAGKPGFKKIEVNAVDRFVKVLSVKPPVPGDDIYLTIDADLQRTAQDAFKGKMGAIAVLDPRNGQILAFYSSPGINLNWFSKKLTKKIVSFLYNKDTHPFMDRVIQGCYAPGSIFKIVVAAAGLQTGVITPSTIFYCPGYLKLGRRIFRCWDWRGHGKVDLYKGIVQSCDVYFYHVGLLLGPDKISKFAHYFGFGEKTGIDLAGEATGLIPTPEWKLRRWQQKWQDGDTLNMAIGQGFVLVTPIQAARMISAVANPKGLVLKPQYIYKIKDWQGEILSSFKPVVQWKLPVKRRYLNEIRRALEGVVEDRHGTGWRCRIPNLKVCGKTGTAQVIKQAKRTREKKLEWKYRDHAWFVAYAPANNPKIAVAVLVEHGGHGGSAAAPIAKKIFECWLKLQHPRPAIQAPMVTSLSNLKIARLY